MLFRSGEERAIYQVDWSSSPRRPPDVLLGSRACTPRPHTAFGPDVVPILSQLADLTTFALCVFEEQGDEKCVLEIETWLCVFDGCCTA